MTHFTTIAGFTAQTGADAPTKAELALIKACVAGEICTCGDGKRPTGPSPARSIRADLLRLLILGGDAATPVHTNGVRLIGGYIIGPLTLDFGRARGMTSLAGCTFTDPVSALQTRFDLLSLAGSQLPGLMAQGAKVSGPVFLTKGFHATRRVTFADSRISGQLNCKGARFDNPEGAALNAQGIRVKGGLIWREITVDAGGISLAAAHVSDLSDDLESWPKGENRLSLDGFTYDRISGSFTDAPQRLEWLKRGTVWDGEFRPQPYVQLAKVLRAMGHDRAARKTLIAMESLLAAAKLREDREKYDRLRCAPSRPVSSDAPEVRGDMGQHWVQMHASRLWSGMIRKLVGYGHAPARALYWTLRSIGFATVFYYIAWCVGAMVPNSAVILTSPDWAAAMQVSANTPTQHWLTLPSATHFETFSAATYAADVFIPLIDFGQEAAWTATTATAFGTAAWIFAWLLKSFGWLVTALGAAAVTGIIRRD